MSPRKALALLLVLAPISAVGADDSPPKDLHREPDGHWTAWDEPDAFPEGAELYDVVPGDTLWDLGARFLGDPYLWPQIWEQNRYIQDAHWIYPGDTLVMGLTVAEPETPETTEIEAPAEEQVAEAGEGEAAAVPQGPRYPFVQLGTADDIYCSGYVGDPKEEFPFRIAGSEYEVMKPSLEGRGHHAVEAKLGVVDTIKYGLSYGDIVYLDRGSDGGLRPGDLLTSVTPRGIVHHPKTGKPAGRYYQYHGRVQVLAVQAETAIGEIVQSCYPITVGSVLKPFVPEPVPSERRKPMRPPTQPASYDEFDSAATIILAKDNLVTVGQDHVVFIDHGEQDDLVPGDILTVYRSREDELPALVLGEIAILSVRPTTAVAKVVRSRYPMYVGDLALVN